MNCSIFFLNSYTKKHIVTSYYWFHLVLGVKLNLDKFPHEKIANPTLYINNCSEEPLLNLRSYS